MRGPRLTEENLRNQIDVVKEEIRVNVLNRPYGGFPWLKLPPVMFDTLPNAHDGYGSFVDLESRDRRRRGRLLRPLLRRRQRGARGRRRPRRRPTRPALVERHFGDVPARPAPARPDFAEPDLTAERRESYTDPLAPLPGGRRRPGGCPTRSTDFAGYLPYVVLAEVLTDGDASRLVRAAGAAATARSPASAATSGFMGDPFDVRDPTALLLQAHLPPGGDVGQGAAHASTRSSTGWPPTASRAGELARTQARMATHLLRDTDAVLGRALRMAVLEQQRGDAELLNELPRGWSARSPTEQVAGGGRDAAPAPPRRRSRSSPGGAR